MIRENLEQYKNEQPVIDSERQLSEKMVDEEVMGALQRTGYMMPQHMTLIDTVLIMPGKTIEEEQNASDKSFSKSTWDSLLLASICTWPNLNRQCIYRDLSAI